MSTYDVLQAMNKIAIDKSTDNLKTGRIVRERANDTYDTIALGDKTTEMPSLKPVNTNEKYKKGDGVFLGIPYGNEGLLRIMGRSNIEIPDEKEHRFRSKTIAPDGTIYLAILSTYTIVPYSLSGAKETELYATDYVKSICVGSDGYIYSVEGLAWGSKIPVDGDSINLNFDPRGCYYNFYGLAINSDCSYLYVAGTEGTGYYIARIPTATGIINATWKELTKGTSFASVLDLCGDSNYLYILTDTCIKKYNYSGTYQSEITVSGYGKIYSDGTNIYLNSSSTVAIYTIDGTFVRSIEGAV